jgi:hypothetical protein
MELIVTVEYDDEARVWLAHNDDLGLATQAETMEVLTHKLPSRPAGGFLTPSVAVRAKAP